MPRGGVPGPGDEAANFGDTNRTTIALDELGLGCCDPR
jgi:hypothetical protein